MAGSGPRAASLTQPRIAAAARWRSDQRRHVAALPPGPGRRQSATRLVVNEVFNASLQACAAAVQSAPAHGRGPRGGAGGCSWLVGPKAQRNWGRLPCPGAGTARPQTDAARRQDLDGLRGLAVLLVIAYHYGVPGSGFLGVDIFFVLSGYLITSILVAEWRGAGSVDYRRFWLRRGLRILPAFWLMLAVVALTTPFSEILISGSFLRNWSMAFDWWPVQSPLGPTWSPMVTSTCSPFILVFAFFPLDSDGRPPLSSCVPAFGPVAEPGSGRRLGPHLLGSGHACGPC